MIRAIVVSTFGMIIAAGYDGVSTDWRDRERSKRIVALIKPHGLTAEGQCFPQTVDDLKPVLDIATETGLHCQTPSH